MCDGANNRNCDRIWIDSWKATVHARESILGRAMALRRGQTEPIRDRAIIRLHAVPVLTGDGDRRLRAHVTHPRGFQEQR